MSQGGHLCQQYHHDRYHPHRHHLCRRLNRHINNILTYPDHLKDDQGAMRPSDPTI